MKFYSDKGWSFMSVAKWLKNMKDEKTHDYLGHHLFPGSLTLVGPHSGEDHMNA